jgi:uncharacterized membrane protein YfcA
MPIAIGTSLLIIVANSAAGVISHLHGTSIDWSVTTAFVSTAIAGSLIAGHFGTKIDTRRLQHWFAYLVSAVAAYVLIDTGFQHSPTAQSPYERRLVNRGPLSMRVKIRSVVTGVSLAARCSSTRRGSRGV